MNRPAPLRHLRSLDWRFLLRAVERPRIAVLTRGQRPSSKLAAIGEIVGVDENPDLAVLGFPRRSSLRRAARALGAEGQVLSTWRLPRPWGTRRARRRLQRGGFAEVRFYRPGPDPGEAPARWAPLQPAPREPLDPPPPSPRAAALRRLWRWLGPVYAVAGRPAGSAGRDPLQQALPDARTWILLTGGSDEAAKAVGLPLGPEGERLPAVVKFARNDAAERGLRREADLLEQLAERSSLPGVPRLRARGSRAGRFAIVQDAAAGKPLNASLDLDAFAATAPAVTAWLLELARGSQLAPADSWAPRLVEEPLDEVAERLGAQLGHDFPARARAALANLGELPLVWEHRDFGPWNVHLDEEGSLCVIDWEDSEPRGLPGLDLAYFLASAAASFEDPTGAEPDRWRRALRRLADAGAEPGRTAAACIERYCRALGVDGEEFRRLRLLCWLVQAKIALRHSPPGRPPSADAQLFAALALDELERQ